MEALTSNSTSANAEENNNLDFGNNTKLINKEDIKDTPFKVITTEQGCFISLGAKIVTQKMSEEEAIIKAEEIKRTDWRMMLSIITIVVQETVAQLHIDMMKFNEEMIGKEVKNG